MAAYYDFFSTHKARNEPIISIRYIDAFGTGKKLKLPVLICTECEEWALPN